MIIIKKKSGKQKVFESESKKIESKNSKRKKQMCTSTWFNVIAEFNSHIIWTNNKYY